MTTTRDALDYARRKRDAEATVRPEPEPMVLGSWREYSGSVEADINGDEWRGIYVGSNGWRLWLQSADDAPDAGGPETGEAGKRAAVAAAKAHGVDVSAMEVPGE